MEGMARLLACMVSVLMLAGIVGCSPADDTLGSPPKGSTTNGPGDPHSGADGSGAGGDNGGDPGATTPTALDEFGVCFTEFGPPCKSGLDCIKLDENSYCLSPCNPPSVTCAAGQVCDAQHCRRATAYYAATGRLDACPPDTLGISLIPLAPTRCVPICEAGDLSDHQAVSACPSLPPGVTGGPVTCRGGLLATTTAKFCVAEVEIGAPCDQFALRCNADGDRPDSDPDHEATAAGRPDPGAPRCLPIGVDSFCLRVCSIDHGQTTSPCSCDGACSDPLDPGLTPACEGWADLAPDLRACVAP
jgi:hypothetical protein